MIRLFVIQKRALTLAFQAFGKNKTSSAESQRLTAKSQKLTANSQSKKNDSQKFIAHCRLQAKTIFMRE
ncbi:MAG: hypothetical protein U0L53_08605 [Bacteroidales bacterium]|nr:hypothetical protein [Bacteroidales bacterium]